MTDTFADCIRVATAELVHARHVLQAEISSYPTPISGCDAQFNHLLAERQKIAVALRALGSEVFIPTPRCPAPQAGVESR